MARIKTYPIDSNVTINDFVLGTDGDFLYATKNYKLLTLLNYLGTQYNLNSTDLLFNYSKKSSLLVTDGEVSTNNYNNTVVSMSGVTNIYVSKITAFGQLVEDLLNTIGTNTMTILFADMGNKNNFGIFSVVSTQDVSINTINMSVTSQVTSGVITSGIVMGIRIGFSDVGESSFVDLSDTPSSFTGQAGLVPTVKQDETGLEFKEFVDLTSTQTIGGEKTFSSIIIHQSPVTFNSDIFAFGSGIFFNSSIANPSIGSNFGFLSYRGSDEYRFKTSGGNFSFKGNSINLNRVYNVPNKNGTLALLDDINLTGFVTLSTNQLIVGIKTFANTGEFNNSLNINQGTLRFTNSTNSITDSVSVFRLFNHQDKLGWKKSTQGGGVFAGTALIDQNNTLPRTYTLPDKDGTVAMLEDIPSDILEEVEFFPTLIDTTGGATYSISGNSFYYKKGNVVHFNVSMGVINSTGTPSGFLEIRNLPFTPKRPTGVTLGNLVFSGTSDVVAESFSLELVATNNAILFRRRIFNNSSFGFMPSPVMTNGIIRVSGTYITT